MRSRQTGAVVRLDQVIWTFIDSRGKLSQTHSNIILIREEPKESPGLLADCKMLKLDLAASHTDLGRMLLYHHANACGVKWKNSHARLTSGQKRAEVSRVKKSKKRRALVSLEARMNVPPGLGDSVGRFNSRQIPHQRARKSRINDRRPLFKRFVFYAPFLHNARLALIHCTTPAPNLQICTNQRSDGKNRT